MEKVALVIGNSKYEKINKLRNAVKDAEDMSEKLKLLEFEVFDYYNLDLNDISAAVNDFAKTIADANVNLFFYAGHGIQIRNKNFIIPVDYEFEDDENKSILSCYGVDQYFDKISCLKDKINIIILDACRDNPFRGLMRGSMKHGYSTSERPPSGSIIAFSTKEGSSASDGDVGSTNGLYTGVLLQYIEKANIKIEDLFKITRTKVLELSGNSQEPWEYTCLTGDFCFNEVEKKQVTYSNQEIFDFIKSKGDYYESKGFHINDVECLPYIDAQEKFDITIIELLRIYSKIQYEKQGKYKFSDEDIDEININYLDSWGFKYQNYRWYYKNKYVKMGDPLPISENLRELFPNEGSEIEVDIKPLAQIYENKLFLTIETNLPLNTPILCSINGKDVKYYGQSKINVIEGLTKTGGFTNKGNRLEEGIYYLSIIVPIYNVLPNDVKELFGERNRNLIGKYIKYTPIGGNTVNYKATLIIQDDKISII